MSRSWLKAKRGPWCGGVLSCPWAMSHELTINPPSSSKFEFVRGRSHYPLFPASQQPASQLASKPASQPASQHRWIDESSQLESSKGFFRGSISAAKAATRFQTSDPWNPLNLMKPDEIHEHNSKLLIDQFKPIINQKMPTNANNANQCLKKQQQLPNECHKYKKTIESLSICTSWKDGWKLSGQQYPNCKLHFQAHPNKCLVFVIWFGNTVTSLFDTGGPDINCWKPGPIHQSWHLLGLCCY